MQILLFILFCHLSFPAAFITHDQIPDLLIVDRDTILLKTFPLEELGFSTRPFHYGLYDFPDEYCYRGYKATWKVKGNKLYLTEVVKADASEEKLDMVQYFRTNGYDPIVIENAIFADWFTKDLTSFPRNYSYWGCIWKSKCKKQKPSMRFENGILRQNKYHGRGLRR